MSDYANNETSVAFTHLARKFYNENFLSEGEIHTTNYWKQHGSYGKMNQKMDTIVVNKHVVVPVTNDSKALNSSLETDGTSDMSTSAIGGMLTNVF